MRTPICLAALFVAASLTTSICPPAWAVDKADTRVEKDDDDDGAAVKMEDLPEAVRKTLKREAGDGKIKEIEKETKKGKTVYEADVVIDGDEYEIKIAANGKLISKVLDDEEDEDDDD